MGEDKENINKLLKFLQEIMPAESEITEDLKKALTSLS